MTKEKYTSSPHIHEKPDPRHSNVSTKLEEVLDGTEESGGPKGPEPTRYGDWEQNGRCTDF